MRHLGIQDKLLGRPRTGVYSGRPGCASDRKLGKCGTYWSWRRGLVWNDTVLGAYSTQETLHKPVFGFTRVIIHTCEVMSELKAVAAEAFLDWRTAQCLEE